MPNPRSAERQSQFSTPNTQRSCEIGRKDLPLHCPMPGASLWNSHPKVYLPIEDAKDGRMICPYCSTQYILIND
jgi:uncharacterized Zn-finger protein